MAKCVIKLGDVMTYSILEGDQLIFHKVFSKTSELPDALNKLDIEEMLVFIQGTPTDKVPDDSWKISNFMSNNVWMTMVVPSSNIVHFSNLASVLGIKNVRIYSYTDFIEDKYKDEHNLILVDSFNKGYCVMAIRDGKIIDFKRRPSTQLRRVIGDFKTLYGAPVERVSRKVDSIVMRSSLANYSKIPKSQLFALGHIPFCLNNPGKSLLNNNDMTPVDDIFDRVQDTNGEESDKAPSMPVDDMVDDLFSADVDYARRPSGNRTKKKRGFTRKAKSNVRLFEDEKTNKVINIVCSCVAVVVIGVCIVGVGASILYKGKLETTQKKVDIAQQRVKSADDMTAYLKGDVSKSPMFTLASINSKKEDINVSSMNYEYGKTSVTVLSSNDEERDKAKESLEQSLTIKEYASMGNFKQDNTTYMKTKFIVEIQDS